MRSKLIIGASLIALFSVVVLGVKVLGGKAMTAYLKANAAVWGQPMSSKDGRFQIKVYRYPRLADVPESLGFGEGFVQLLEVASDKVLAEKGADDLAAMNWSRWTSNTVATAVAVWTLPP